MLSQNCVRSVAGETETKTTIGMAKRDEEKDEVYQEQNGTQGQERCLGEVETTTVITSGR
jgi:hypothetical protein